MPNEKPWLDDYTTRHQMELQARWDEESRVFNIQNAALRAAINCPLPLRKPADCQMCGEESCIKAYKEQNKLWPEEYEEPAYHANTTSTPQAAAISPAKSGSPGMTKCPAPGQPASGSGLFGRRDEEKAA
jgi:hypothetical protein